MKPTSPIGRVRRPIEVLAPEVEAPAVPQDTLLPTVVKPGVERAPSVALTNLPSLLPGTPVRGRAFEKRIDRLRRVRESDPEVARIFEGIRSRLEGEIDAPALVADLEDPASNTRAVFAGYLEWVAHRDAKPAAEDRSEQARRASLDPALMTTRVAAIVDLLIERIVELDTPIPDDAARGLLALFSGATERIQTRANTWMLNDKISTLVETEQLLLDRAEVDADAVFGAVDQLLALDGGVSIGLQPPGDRRSPEQLPARVASTALMATGTALATTARREIAAGVLAQFKPAADSIDRMETALAKMDATTPAFSECLDVYHAYTAMIGHDAHRLWQHRGVLDRLASAVVEAGNAEHRAAFVDLLYDGVERLKALSNTPKIGRGWSFHDVRVELDNAVLARAQFDGDALDFVFGAYAALASLPDARTLDSDDAGRVVARIRAFRRSDVPSDASVREAMKHRDPTAATLGPYQMRLCVRDSSADGVPGKTLEVRDLRSKISSDNASLTTLAHLERIARSEGFTAIQLADWSNIHEGRVFEADPAFSTTMRPVPIGQGGRVVEEPTYVKSLGLDTAELTRFLDHETERALVKLGPFTMAFRKGMSIAASSSKAVTLTSVDANEPGTGRYGEALETLANAARERGFEHLVIEGVDAPRHWAFYEKMGFERAPRDDALHRTYVRAL